MLFVTLIILLSLVALSIPVAAALGILGLTLDQIYAPFPLYRAAGEIFWSVGTDFILAAIPMFILLGELLLRSGISTRMYSSIELWLGRMPGGLMHSNIAASAPVCRHLRIQRGHRSHGRHRCHPGKASAMAIMRDCFWAPWRPVARWAS